MCVLCVKFACVCACVHTYMCVCTYVCVCACMRVCTVHICTCRPFIFPLQYEVEGLVPFTSYSVRIAVANANGTGPFSNATQNRTSEDGTYDCALTT